LRDTSFPPLSVAAVCKSFTGVQALNDVSFDCRPGEIHALVGENGAGKSTLMRILTGSHQPDSGTVFVDGNPVRISSPAEARRLGIAMVYQDTKLVPDLDTAQNIFLGHEPGGLLLDYAKMRRETRQLLARLGEDFDSHEPVARKPLAQRQMIELARALSHKARVLILDEPTSALTPNEVERLFVILRELRDAGTAIIFISHRLPEVFEISDRISVLKDGLIVGTLTTADTHDDVVVSMMVGRDLALAYPPRANAVGKPILQVENLSSHGNFSAASFEVRSGEIVGIGGIADSGQQDLVRALFGLVPAKGIVRIDGKPVTIDSPVRAIEAGIVYLPSDRRGEGMFLPHSISDNIALPHVREWSRLGIVDNARQREEVSRQIRSLDIRTPGAWQPVGLLSGGNQQKVTFARWLLSKPRLCIFDEPTQGVDVGTKLEIYGLIRDLTKRGIGVIVVSSDVMELIGISDRILVVADGHLVDEVPGEEATEERIVGSAVKHAPARVVDAAIADPTERRVRRSTETGRLLYRYGPTLLLLALSLALCMFAATSTPYFFTPRNLSNLAIQVAPLTIVALGQFAVIMLGGIDLSAGPNISLSTAIASFLVTAEAPLGLTAGILVVLLAGIGVGLLNSLLIVALRLPDLVATLATFSAISGLALIVRPSPGGLVDFGFADTVLATWGGVPIAIVVAVLIVAVFELILLRGRAGLWLVASGSSAEAAYLAGVATGQVRICAYIFCGGMAALAGLLIAARIGSGDPQSGANFTLLSVTAVVLGGTSIFGGRGTAAGVFIAALLLMIIQNAMNHLQISAYWQYVLTGVLTLVAVAIYTSHGGGNLLRKLMPGQHAA
jgi:ribose transport system ATP-binding protein